MLWQEPFHILNKIRVYPKHPLNRVPLSHKPRTGSCSLMFRLEKCPYIIRKILPIVEMIRENGNCGVLKSGYSELLAVLR